MCVGGTVGVDLDDLVGHQPSGQVELVDPHIDHDPAAHGRVGEGERWRLSVELERLEQHRSPEVARCEARFRPDIVGFPTAHETDLQSDPGARRGIDGGIGVREGQRDGLLAQDVLAGARSELDHLEMAA